MNLLKVTRIHLIEILLFFVRFISWGIDYIRFYFPAFSLLIHAVEQVSFTRSNFSMAFPYVAPSDEETMENLLISGFKEACGHGLQVSNIVFSESCSIEGGDFQKLAFDP